ncbi:MAG: metal-sensing transcriptional repressor [Anaerovoracaceae bacterium]|jgi:DNA-binding FrmR family transcriptional regulator
MKKIDLHYDLTSDECNSTVVARRDDEAQELRPETRAIINRLAKADGHLRSVKKMVENGRDCTEILIQLSAVIAALNNTGKLLLEDHLDHCITSAVQNGDSDAIQNLKIAIERFI